ncbi:MAG: hypothetical protein FH758_08130 [Firmicutes bacterium]|nr:hypothetical protein [Bacillota bacterium]
MRDFPEIQELRTSVNLDNISNNKKKEMLRDLYIYSPTVTNIINAIDEIMENASSYPEAPGLVVYGRSGVGKSLLCKTYLNNFPRYQSETDEAFQTIVPVLRTTMPEAARAKSLVTEMLRKICDPFYMNGRNTITKTGRLLDNIKDCQVKLIILDEFQHVYERGSTRITQEVTDWVKDLLDESHIPILLTGLPTVESIIDSDEQLKTRFKNRYEISPFNYNTKEDQVAFLTFLEILDMKLPLPKKSNLSDPKIAYILFEASGGILRILMMQIIIPLTIQAIDKSHQRIGIEELLSKVSKIVDHNKFDTIKKIVSTEFTKQHKTVKQLDSKKTACK